MEVDELVRLKVAILRDFESLECIVYPDDKYLRISKASKCGLSYLPNFNLIIHSQMNGSFCLRLTTYHGRTLDTVDFNYDQEDCVVPEKVAKSLHDIMQTLRICEGVNADDLVEYKENCLYECFNDSIIMRSLKCKFVLDQGSSSFECDECKKLLIKNELDCNPALMVMSSMKEEDVDIYYHEAYDEEPRPKRGRGRPRKYEDTSIALPEEPVKRGRGRPRKDDPFASSLPVKKPKPKLLALNGEKPYFRFLSETKESPLLNDDRIQCRICLRTYKSETAVAIHFNSHAKFFDVLGTMSCPVCNATIKKLDLTEHFDSCHSSKDHADTCCLACLEVMPHKKGDTLREHIIKFHHQKHMCEICGKVFNYSKFLDCHVKTIHTDVKNYFCDRCGKGFGHQIALQKHVQVACATEEWKCAICAKIFGCRKKIRFHLMVHCEEKPYACKHCAYRSYKADNLSLHVKKTHHLKGVRADFITIPEILKVQSEYVDKYLEKARLK